MMEVCGRKPAIQFDYTNTHQSAQKGKWIMASESRKGHFPKTCSSRGLNKTRVTKAHATSHQLNLHFKLIHSSQGMVPEDSAQPGSGTHTGRQGWKISHVCWLCWTINHKHLAQHFLTWPASEVIEVTMQI